MVRFPEAEARMIRGVFVCRKCKTKRRASPMKVHQGKISCRKCGSKALRPVRKK
jgi:ribosomal protein L40E